MINFEDKLVKFDTVTFMPNHKTFGVMVVLFPKLKQYVLKRSSDLHTKAFNTFKSIANKTISDKKIKSAIDTGDTVDFEIYITSKYNTTSVHEILNKAGYSNRSEAKTTNSGAFNAKLYKIHFTNGLVACSFKITGETDNDVVKRGVRNLNSVKSTKFKYLKNMPDISVYKKDIINRIMSVEEVDKCIYAESESLYSIVSGLCRQFNSDAVRYWINNGVPDYNKDIEPYLNRYVRGRYQKQIDK